MTPTEQRYEGSTFAAALEKMDPEERLRAQRLRDAFNLRDDDALWLYCGLVKGMEAIFEETLGKCVSAVDETLRAELETHAHREPDNGRSKDPTPGHPNAKPISVAKKGPFLVLGSLCVTSTVVIGSAGVTLGSMVRDGQVPWLPRSADAGDFTYAATALLSAPVGGFFALVGLMGFGVMLAVVRQLGARARLAGR